MSKIVKLIVILFFISPLNINLHLALKLELIKKKYHTYCRLSEDPLCYNNTIELAYLGEISSKIKTPFGMHPLEWPSDLTDSDSMVQILISDHIANALLYHSFKLVFKFL